MASMINLCKGEELLLIHCKTLKCTPKSLCILRCIGMKWPMDHVADGHLGLGLNDRWPFRLGLNCQVGHFRLMTSPGLKLPTQSQMADENIFKFDILKFMIA